MLSLRFVGECTDDREEASVSVQLAHPMTVGPSHHWAKGRPTLSCLWVEHGSLAEKQQPKGTLGGLTLPSSLAFPDLQRPGFQLNNEVRNLFAPSSDASVTTGTAGLRKKLYDPCLSLEPEILLPPE